MAPGAKVGEDEEAAETQEHSFTEEDVSKMREKVRELAQQRYTDKAELAGWLGKLDLKLQATSDLQERGNYLQVCELAHQGYTKKDDLQRWSRKLDSELQEISGLQEREDYLQGALEELQEDLRARSVEPAAEQVEALTLLRGASEVLRERWPEDKPPKEWEGVTFREGQVSELSIAACRKLKSLPAEVGGLRALTSLNLEMAALTTLPAEVGGLRALTSLNLRYTALTTLPAEVGGLRALTSLDLNFCKALTTLPAEVGGLRALTSLKLSHCDALTSPPKELHLDLVTIKDRLHGQHLVTQHSAKQWGSDEMLLCLRDRPGVLHALAEQPTAVDLLRSVLEADPTLADITEGDPKGRTPIQHACPECGDAMRAALCLLGRFKVDDGPPLHFSATSAVVQADDLGSTDKTSGADAKPPRRALKAMRTAEQVLAELNGRDGLDPQYVIAVLAVYVDEGVDETEFQSIVTAAKQLQEVTVDRALKLEDRLLHEFSVRVQAPKKVDDSGACLALQRCSSSMLTTSAAAAQELTTPAAAAQEPQAALAAEYPFVIVMSLADRNLNTVLTHDHIAGNDFARIRMIMSHLAQALDNLHSKERIHADFKPLNAARESTWKLIDMDVSRKFKETFGTKIPSSGYCPPEMATVLLALRNTETDEAKTQELAKYKASVAYDLWSFGVVLFNLCYGISLFNTDQNDNVGMDDLQTLAAAPEGPWRKLISKALSPGMSRDAGIDLTAATALLCKLLEPNPATRLEHFDNTNKRPMEAVLDEPFFQGQSVNEAKLGEMNTMLKDIQVDQKKQLELLAIINARTEKIEGLQRATIQLLNEHASSLRACIQAAADDNVPTAFVILVKPPEPSLIEDVTNDFAGIKDSATAAINSRSATEYVSCVEQMTAMYSKGKGLASKISSAISDPGTFLKDQLKLHAFDTLELCLVCEVCWRPQRDDDPDLNGAYNVTTQSELCAKVMPIAKATLYTIKAVNGLAGIAQCFLPGVPTVPKKFLEAGSTLLEELDAPSSVSEFANVQAKLESETKDKDAGKMEGGCLREFTRFLEKEDPENKWADLQRALLTEGQSVWCCKGCIGIIKDKENKDATYEEIRVKVEAKAKLLPTMTGEPANPLQEAKTALKSAVARAEAAEATAAKPTVGLAGVEVEVASVPLVPDTSAAPSAPASAAASAAPASSAATGAALVAATTPPAAVSDATAATAPAALATPAAPPVVNVSICHCGIL